MNTQTTNPAVLAAIVVIADAKVLEQYEHYDRAIRQFIGDKPVLQLSSTHLTKDGDFANYVKSATKVEGKTVIVLGDSISGHEMEKAQKAGLPFARFQLDRNQAPNSDWYNLMGQKVLRICTQDEIQAFKANRVLQSA